MTFQIFKKKVYKTYEDAKLNVKKDNIYFSKDYLNRNIRKLTLQAKKKTNYDYEYSFLKFLHSILILNNNKFNLLDYGGGLGNTILEIYLKNLFKKNLRVSLYDQNTNLVKISQQFFKKKIEKKIYKKISFIKNINNLKKEFDAIHFGSMFEHVNEENLFFKELFYKIRGNPKFLFFSDLFVTNANEKDFYCIGRYYNQNYVVKFHNLKKIISLLKTFNYELIDQKNYLPNIQGQFRFYDMENLPKKNRIYHTMNLIFKKKNNS